VTFSTSSSSSAIARLAAAAVWALLASFAHAALPPQEGGVSIAVLTPVPPPSGRAPVDRIAESLSDALAARGFKVLPLADVDAVLARHRERYTGGVSASMAVAFAEEAGATGILVTSIDDWDESETPRIALTCRWVAATAETPILWMDTAAHHALEAPGAFGLGLGKDADALLDEAVVELAGGVAANRKALEEGRPAARPRQHTVERRFRPRSMAFDASRAIPADGVTPRRVAVLPFFTDGPDREVGEIVALQFVQQLTAYDAYDVVEPGVVRQALLDARVIQDEGVSLAQVDAVRALLNVDAVVSGRVSEFEPLGIDPGSPTVAFTANVIDARSRRVIWASFSFARGDDGLHFFGTGHVRSAVLLTSELVRGVVERVEELKRRSASRRSDQPSTKGSP
jgi:hypothetical protein